MSPSNEVSGAVDTEMGEAIRRGKAIEAVILPPAARIFDEEAFGAFILAITAVLSNGGVSDRIKLLHSDGRGVLQKAHRDLVIFYLHDGFLISSVFPLPGLKTFPYVRNVHGHVLNWYQFSLDHQTMSELEMAKYLVALAG